MNKLIISALLIFGLVGMIGTATANVDIVEGIIYVNEITNPVSGAEVTVYRGSDHTDVIGTYSTESDGSYVIVLPVGYDEPTVFVTATYHDAVENKDMFGSTTGTVTQDTIAFQLYEVDVGLIPEFPTIALPIAAILGLMFIINSRKKEE